MRAEPAGEQAIAVGVVHDLARLRPRADEAARHQVGPGIDVVCRIAYHRRLAGRAGGRMHAHELFARHGEHAERIIVAQVGFQRERKLGNV
jgi:hypothetical protein